MLASTAALMLASTSALGTANRIVTVGGGSVADGSAFGRGAWRSICTRFICNPWRSK